MATKRKVSETQKKALKIAWKGQCVISKIVPEKMPPELKLSLDIDHIIPLALDGSNEFDNLVPLLSSINNRKSGERFDKETESMLKCLAKGKKVEVQTIFEKLSHKRLTFTYRITVAQIPNAILYCQSKNYPADCLRILLTEWSANGVLGHDFVTFRTGKSKRSQITKLVNMKIYKAGYTGRRA